jgi:hypothetical protein
MAALDCTIPSPDRSARVRSTYQFHIDLSIYLSIYLCTYLSIYVPIYLSMYLSMCWTRTQLKQVSSGEWAFWTLLISRALWIVVNMNVRIRKHQRLMNACSRGPEQSLGLEHPTSATTFTNASLRELWESPESVREWREGRDWSLYPLHRYGTWQSVGLVAPWRDEWGIILIMIIDYYNSITITIMIIDCY